MSLLSYASPWTSEGNQHNTTPKKRVPTLGGLQSAAARKTIKNRTTYDNGPEQYESVKPLEVPDDELVNKRGNAIPESIDDYLEKQTDRNTKINSILNKITSVSTDDRLGDFIDGVEAEILFLRSLYHSLVREGVANFGFDLAAVARLDHRHRRFAGSIARDAGLFLIFLGDVVPFLRHPVGGQIDLEVDDAIGLIVQSYIHDEPAREAESFKSGNPPLKKSTVRSRAGGENGVAHAVEEFFVVRANRGKRPAERGGFFPDEKIRAQAHAAAHRLQSLRAGLPEFGIK